MRKGFSTLVLTLNRWSCWLGIFSSLLNLRWCLMTNWHEDLGSWLKIRPVAGGFAHATRDMTSNTNVRGRLESVCPASGNLVEGSACYCTKIRRKCTSCRLSKGEIDSSPRFKKWKEKTQLLNWFGFICSVRCRAEMGFDVRCPIVLPGLWRKYRRRSGAICEGEMRKTRKKLLYIYCSKRVSIFGSYYYKVLCDFHLNWLSFFTLFI